MIRTSVAILLLAWALPMMAQDENAAPTFDCEFESSTWFQEWGLDEAQEFTDTVSEDVQRKFEPLNGKALRIRVKKGGHYGASLQYEFKKRTGSEPEEVYFRYYLRLADDWKPERGGKLPGIAGTYGRAGWGGRPVNGTDGWSARGLFRGRKDGKTPIGVLLLSCCHGRQVWRQLAVGKGWAGFIGEQSLVLH